MKPILVSSLVFSLLAFAAQPAKAGELQVVPLRLPAAAANLAPIGRLPASTNLSLAIALPLRNAEALDSLLREIYDPSSAHYRRYLTPEEFAARFGPAEQDYEALKAFAKSNGLAIAATHPNRMLLDVIGSVAQIESVFHTTLRTYPRPGENRLFYAPDTAPAAYLPVRVLGISGLDNYSLPRPRIHATRLAQEKDHAHNSGSGLSGTYMGGDFRAAYVPGTPLNGSGQTVGLLQFDGYTSNDIAYYESQAKLPNVPLVNVLLDGFGGNPTGSGGEVEVSLDIEMSISMAPGLSKVIVYEAGPSGNWHDILNRMATDNLAKQLSCSWYIPNGGPDSVADQIWMQMAAQGQSFFNASGDADAYTGPIEFPGDSPYITQVGGTTLTTSGPLGPWVSETVWNWGNGTGSGGGVSTSYTIPSWQTNISMASNQGSTVRRNTPDVAMTADNVYVRADGVDYSVGGTSCAAPLWAGFTALINQLALQNGEPLVGFINPAVSVIGAGGGYASSFRDITTGNNESSSSPTRFLAVTGYDLCTGWGTPAGSKLLYALGVPEPLQITSPSGTVFSGPVRGPFVPASQILSLTNNAGASLNWSLGTTSAWLNAFPASGTLATGGPADTVTLSVNPVASNLAAGSYPAFILVTNRNDQFVQSREYTLAVVTQPVITGQPVYQTLLEGATAVFTVSTASNALLSYQWRMHAGGATNNLADGDRISGSRAGTLLVGNVSAADQGAYSVVVSNIAGTAISQDAPLTLVPFRPVISSEPAAQTVLPGQSAAFTVAAIGTHPFSYQWRRKGTNLADGGKIAGSATTNLTVIAATAAEAGNYSIVVSNSLGSALSTGAKLSVVSVTAPGVLLDVLSSFTGTGTSGALPYNSLVQAGDGNFYGTTLEGGVYGDGTIFRLSTNGTLTTIYSFDYNSGAIPYGALLLGRDGYLYGTASQGGANGYGTAFKISTQGTFSTLVSFNGGNGEFPVGGLAQGADGNLYGTTLYGGAPGLGNVFRMTTNGAVTSLFSFNGDNGEYPSGVLVQDGQGNFYGTTENGGSTGWGVIFSITPAGAFNIAAEFNGLNGGVPAAGLLRDSDGSFYGTTYYGGTNDDGNVFRMTPDGTITSLHSFTGGADGANPFAGLVLGADGNFYGSTTKGGAYSDGTLFMISRNGAFLTLASFDGFQGASPEGAPAQGADGVFYGTTQSGGANGAGAVYRFTIDAPLQITGQPSNVLAYLGGEASFDVAVFGAMPVSFQWRMYGTNLADGGSVSGANSRMLTLTNVAVGDAGVYSVIASNVYGAVTSAPAVLQVVISPPWIRTQPAGQTVLEGESASFHVDAEGDMPLVYQWQRSGTNLADGGAISGSRTATLTLSGVTTNDTGAYSVVVSDDLYWVASSDAALTVLPVVQPGFSMTPLRSFTGSGDGANPEGLVQGGNGFLYGTTQNGGSSSYGTAFRMNTNGAPSFTSPFNQANGAYPYCGMAQARDGNFYGTTLEGGSSASGSVYRMSPSGTILNLYSFTGGLDGYYPVGALIQGTDGGLYGTTYYGGAYGDGTIFKITTNGILTTLYSFAGAADGAYPWAGLVETGNGTFYGTTLSGGSSGYGTVFRLSANGVMPLVQFDWNRGAVPYGGLAVGSDGNLYGTTELGGTNGDGTVFRMTPGGTLTTLFHFSTATGTDPAAALVQGSDGYFYGTTVDSGAGGYGSVFRIDTNGTLATLIWFMGANGASPQAPLIQAMDGSFYGTTFSGGSNQAGTVFRLVAPLPPHIVAQPADQTEPAGSDITFDVSVIGTAPLSYQWKKGGTNLVDGAAVSGSSSRSLSISGITSADAGTYSVAVTNKYGYTVSRGAVLLVQALAPEITLQPTNQTFLPGMTATFTAAASGSKPLYYHWMEDGAPLSDGGRISGSAASVLTISNVSAADEGTYSLDVSNFVDSTASTGAVLSVVTLTAPGISLETLSSLGGTGSAGANPNGLVLASDGRLYGTSQGGGSNSSGTIFVLTAGGAVVDLYSFTGGSDGAFPNAALVQAADGALYGTATGGGPSGVGALFRFSTNGALTPLHVFAGADGAAPYSPLVAGRDGMLYGTTYFGGVRGYGAIFRITTNGVFTNLYSFFGTADGGSPNAGLVQAGDGKFYGTASGSAGPGTIFSVTTHGDLATLHSFVSATDGATPNAALMPGADGNFYGTASAGGPYDQGTVFRVATNGAFSELYCFTNDSDGAAPYSALYQARDGTLYGTTPNGGAYDAGTVFQMATNGVLATLATFDGYDGANPLAPLVEGPDGFLYGTTQNGGANGGGTVFRLALPGPLVPPVLEQVVQTNGILSFSWSVIPPHHYQVQFASSLSSSNWTPLLLPKPLVSGGRMSLSDAIGTNSERYYRVVVQP